MANSGRDIQTRTKSGTTIVQSFGKETAGSDMRGPDQYEQRNGTLGGDIRSLRHSITEDARVTGVPTVNPPHRTKTAV